MSNHAPRWIPAIIVPVCLGLTGWWAWTYTGLYRLIAEAQLSVFGQYYMDLTLVLTAAGTLLPPIGLVVTVFGRGSPGSSPRGPAWLERSPRAVGIAAVGFGLMVVGGWNLFSVAGLDEPVPTELAAVAAGGASSWVHLRGGVPVWDDALSMEDNHVEDVYVPLVTEGGGPPYVVFAKGEALEAEFDGMVTAGGLPGLIRTEYERAGVIADEHWLVDTRDGPSRRRGMGWAFIILGSVAALGGGVYLFFRG
jgi:hypothetical protein